MKKRWISVAAAMVLAMNILPVSAGELTDDDPKGETEVTANISSSGDVTYIISIPSKINFGTLQQPESKSTPHLAVSDYTVKAVEIKGLDTTTSRVAVLLKDPSQTGGFQIQGQSTANSGKSLKYSIYNGTGTSAADVTTGKSFPNGNLLTAFDKSGESITGELRLDQNQLFGEELDNWAGNYKGTINFYSKIVSMSDIK